mmetsp:Transcript_9655/g.21475  ORF Transcript_9655/g.21475 Transcript_9655/m.21475 type:complete len:211 (+) Transcript_9655:1253-1885(+)
MKQTFVRSCDPKAITFFNEILLTNFVDSAGVNGLEKGLRISELLTNLLLELGELLCALQIQLLQRCNPAAILVQTLPQNPSITLPAQVFDSSKEFILLHEHAVVGIQCAPSPQKRSKFLLQKCLEILPRFGHQGPFLRRMGLELHSFWHALSSFHKFPLVHREECQIVGSELLLVVEIQSFKEELFIFTTPSQAPEVRQKGVPAGATIAT